MAHARSLDGDCATGYVGCGRFGFFHHDALAIGKNLVNTSLLGLQHTLSRSKNLLAGSRESRTGYGGKLIFQYLDVVLLVWHNESFWNNNTAQSGSEQSCFSGQPKDQLGFKGPLCAAFFTRLHLLFHAASGKLCL